jgi:long-chain acyl-CoA synthetase
MVIGEGEKFTSALISPNNLSIKEWCKEEGVEFTSIKELISNGKVSDLFNGIVKEFNSTLGKDEQVKRFRLVPEEWTPDTGEMSPTLKLKRRVLMDNYKAEIDDIFQH